MKRFLIITILVFLFIPKIFAGDVANFVNLGFSSDGKYFLFGFHGVDQVQKLPYAGLFAVDNLKNEFYADGQFNYIGENPLKVGQDSVGALYNLFIKAISLINKLKINHLNQGRILYMLLNGEVQSSELSFKDYETSNEYTVSLSQNQNSVNGKYNASFFLTLKIKTLIGNEKAFVIGNANFKRPDVKNYVVRQIILSPDETYIVAVIEKHVDDKNGGFSVRYMVETTKIK